MENIIENRIRFEEKYSEEIAELFKIPISMRKSFEDALPSRIPQRKEFYLNFIAEHKNTFKMFFTHMDCLEYFSQLLELDVKIAKEHSDIIEVVSFIAAYVEFVVEEFKLEF